MDSLYLWLISLGAKSKEISTLRGRMIFLCSHFKLEYMEISNGKRRKILNSLRDSINDGTTARRERFVVHCLQAMPSSNLEWDLDHCAFCRSKGFLQTQTWKNLRFKALERSNKCQACGRSPEDGIVLHVDHILPRSIYPEYGMNLNNLQILCADCNMGKGNMHKKDFRPIPGTN